LPRGTVEALAPIIDPLVRPLDLRVTRAELVDRGASASGPAGRHLALYVEPMTAFSDDRLVQTIVPLARVLTPFVLQQWPGVESYDICQESPGSDGGPAQTQTVFDVSRAYALAADWSRVDLAALVDQYNRGRPGLRMVVTPRLQPALDAAVR